MQVRRGLAYISRTSPTFYGPLGCPYSICRSWCKLLQQSKYQCVYQCALQQFWYCIPDWAGSVVWVAQIGRGRSAMAVEAVSGLRNVCAPPQDESRRLQEEVTRGAAELAAARAQVPLPVPTNRSLARGLQPLPPGHLNAHPP